MAAPSEAFEQYAYRVNSEYADLVAANVSTAESHENLVGRYLISESPAFDSCQAPYGALLETASVIAFQQLRLRVPVGRINKLELISIFQAPTDTTLLLASAPEDNLRFAAVTMGQEFFNPFMDSEERLIAFDSFVRAVGALADSGTLTPISLLDMQPMYELGFDLDQL